jgi:hypothetical protein
MAQNLPETPIFWFCVFTTTQADIATTLRDGRSGVRIPVQTKEIFSLLKYDQMGSGYPQPPIQWAPRLFPGSKEVGDSRRPLISIQNSSEE